MLGEASHMSMDKGKAIESALLQIEKKFGKGSIMRLGERPHRGDRCDLDQLPQP